MIKRILCFLAVFRALACTAATVDTVLVYSVKMQKNIPCVVIRPDSYKIKNSSFPVVYLLHGYSGNYANWVNKVSDIKKEADLYKIMIVCPDGAYSSWYLDSPVDSSAQYETFISAELPAYIDKHYHTINNKHARAIAGLSMGGYGSLMIAFHHPRFFGACGSMSGAFDLATMPHKFAVVKSLGDSATHAASWNNYLLVNIIDRYSKTDSIAITMDCGVDDYFIMDNRAVHAKLLQSGIPHDYTERPGNHNWDYWANSIQYQLLFFRNYFDRYYK
jgi:S-formylglutathione hydrolase FrmB